ncbi:MAG: protease complex subunit PrcB family protein [Bacillota bacterium]|nr:protease complex subunit PrcB family protein [Bacillota bacterium]MDW7682603.1 protease complex subunit PrcB family protein [Bacillota bacterium]
MPQPITDWAETLKNRAGVFSTVYREYQVYLIAAGEKRSGGYRIVATPDPGKANTVNYTVENPGPDDFVIQVITYPYEVLLTEKGTPLQFIQNEKGRYTAVEPIETQPLTG